MNNYLFALGEGAADGTSALGTTRRGVLLNNLSIGYSREKSLAEAITATATEGRLTCLLGANGMGKTTLMRTMAGFMPPLAGSLSINGHDSTHLSARRMAHLVSVVFANATPSGNMTVWDMVAMGRTPYTNFWGKLSRRDREIADRAIEMAGIGHLKDRKLHAVSDGERQKTMIAKALAQQTPVLLLDEPTAFLDYPSRAELMAMLRQLAHDEEKTVLISTHDIELAMQTADYLWLLASGTLTAATPQDHDMRLMIKQQLNYDSTNSLATK